MTHVELAEYGIVTEGVSIDVFAKDAVARLRECLGPTILEGPVGVRGSGRASLWFESGLIVMSEVATTELRSVYMCFHAVDGNPFPSQAPQAPVYTGSVVIAGKTFRGGEAESMLRRASSCRRRWCARGTGAPLTQARPRPM